MCALKADGSIKAWGAPGFGTIGVPDGKGYTNIYSNTATFAALKSDGSIASWGSGSADMPSDSGYTYAPSDSGPRAPHALIEPSALRAAKALLVE
jgi:alpha-tubulin suppressor-like RCC1 family protein